MAFNLVKTRQSEIYMQDGTAWVNLPMPPGLQEGAYTLDINRTRPDGSATFSYVRFGNPLIRVPLVNVTPSQEMLAAASSTELACVLCGLDLANKLVRCRSWLNWPDNFLCVHVEDMPGLVIGIAALV